MKNIPDHPDIQAAERYGYPYGKEPTPVCCPVCGKECDIIYTDRASGEAVGCDMCITMMCADDYAG